MLEMSKFESFLPLLVWYLWTPLFLEGSASHSASFTHAHLEVGQLFATKQLGVECLAHRHIYGDVYFWNIRATFHRKLIWLQSNSSKEPSVLQYIKNVTAAGLWPDYRADVVLMCTWPALRHILSQDILLENELLTFQRTKKTLLYMFYSASKAVLTY